MPDRPVPASAFRRFAVYFAPPPDTPLGRFGRDWLGVDTETGVTLSPSRFGVEGPRRYGFHATLKAPLRLAAGVDFADLMQDVETLAERMKPVTWNGLHLRRLGSFLALVPEPQPRTLAELAWRCVTELDHLRDPTTDVDRARYDGLDGIAAGYLDDFGYPWVGDKFRFHLTLSPKLDDGMLDRLEKELVPLTDRFRSESFAVEDLCVFGDPGENGRFSLLARVPLCRPQVPP